MKGTENTTQIGLRKNEDFLTRVTEKSQTAISLGKAVSRSSNDISFIPFSSLLMLPSLPFLMFLDLSIFWLYFLIHYLYSPTNV